MIGEKMNLMPISKALFCLLLFSASTSAWTMRCGNCLISSGDSKALLLSCCGDPYSGYETKDHSIESGNPLQEWYMYHCKDGFAQQVNIEQGIIRSIENKGRVNGTQDCR